MSRWFRHYAGMMRDEKLVRAALKARQPVERVVWVYGVILESAAEIDDAGRYELDHAEVAYFLRADEADIANIEIALGDLGRVHEGHVAKWATRQFQSDRSAERTQRYRDRHKACRDDEAVVSVTSRDDVVTSQKRHGDAPETETETEKKELSRSKPTERAPSRFGEFWQAYPRRDGPNPRKDAEIKFNRMVKSGINPQTMIDAAKQLAIDEQRRGNVGTRFIPQAVTWLNGQRWIDHAAEVLDKKFEDDGLIEVIEDDALSAWDAYSRAKNGKTFPRNARGGWRFPSKYPPGYQPQTGEASPPVIPQLSRMSPQP